MTEILKLSHLSHPGTMIQHLKRCHCAVAKDEHQAANIVKNRMSAWSGKHGISKAKLDSVAGEVTGVEVTTTFVCYSVDVKGYGVGQMGYGVDG